MLELTQLAAGPYRGTVRGEPHARPVILLPALGFGPEIWRDCAAILAQRYRVSCLELPTLAQLGTASHEGALDAYTKWLAALLQQDGFENATVAGIDFTAQLAMRLLAGQAAGLHKVVAMAPTGLGHAIDPLARLLRYPGLGYLILRLAAGLKLKRLVLPHVYHPQRLPESFLKEFFVAIQRPARRQAVLDIIRHIALHEDDPILLEQAGRFNRGVTLVWGEQDRKLLFTYGQRFASALQLPLHKINYAGHLPPLEQPRWTASLIEHAMDARQPVHIDLRGYNGVACADYIVRSEIAARALPSGSELIIHTLYQCAGEDAKTWDRLSSKFGLLGIDYVADEWQIHVTKK